MLFIAKYYSYENYVYWKQLVFKSALERGSVRNKAYKKFDTGSLNMK